MNRIYLDNNATAPMHLESIEAMNAAVAISGNPSAQHADGRKANALISSAREKLGLAMGQADPAQEAVGADGVRRAAP